MFPFSHITENLELLNLQVEKFPTESKSVQVGSQTQSLWLKLPMPWQLTNTPPTQFTQTTFRHLHLLCYIDISTEYTIKELTPLSDGNVDIVRVSEFDSWARYVFMLLENFKLL